MRNLLREIDLEPVGRVVPRDIGFELRRRPIRHGVAEFGLRHGDALGAIDLGEAAGEDRLGLVIERADELRLPAVPHARSDRLDVHGGEDGEQLEPLDRSAPPPRNSRSSCGRRDRAIARRSTSRDDTRPATRPCRSPPPTGPGAGRPAAPRARRRSNDPRSGPWRCRAGTARSVEACGGAAGSCASGRWRTACRRCGRPRCRRAMPMQRSRCSSTV